MQVRKLVLKIKKLDPRVIQAVKAAQLEQQENNEEKNKKEEQTKSVKSKVVKNEIE